MLDKIRVLGARQHNLKNINVDIPRNTLTVITGLSGSGKSSLAFDTIYAEGQRRYVQTLSAYARQFLEQMERPDVDAIEGLSPAISIEQKTTTRSPRSTVGTVTEIYDYLRLLYSSIGVPYCPNCDIPIAPQSPQQIVQRVLQELQGRRVSILAPVVRGRKGEYRKELEDHLRQGFLRARIDGQWHSLEEPVTLDRRKKHTIEILVDRLLVREGIEKRLEASIRTAVRLTRGLVTVAVVDGPETLFSTQHACPECGESIPQLEPRSFSFNSPYGACPACNGLGSVWRFDPAKVIVDPSKPLLDGALGPASSSTYFIRRVREGARQLGIDIDQPFEQLPKSAQKALLEGSKEFPGILELLEDTFATASESYREWLIDYMTPTTCSACSGTRLRPSSRAVRVKGVTIGELVRLPVSEALKLIRSWQLDERERQIAGRILEEVQQRLEFLIDVGLDYISLDRSAATLSGGEAQRTRLATQIGSRLRGVLYVLDEPSIGLHARDNARLLDTLARLRDLGNTVIVVEHDQETIERADWVIDLGPGAGRHGGELVTAGPPEVIRQSSNSLTGQYLAGKLQIPVPQRRRSGTGKFLEVRGARHHNLKNITVRFPLGTFICVTGVSGSGKSSLVDEIVYRALKRALYDSNTEVGEHDEIRGIEHIDKVIEIDQAPIGRTPRSNPATYTGVFTPIRELFAKLPAARERGYKPGRFSFNVKGGRCEACQGDGVKRIEMGFLPDVFVTCEVCRGKRYNQETLQVKYKGYSIADVLEATVDEALALFENIPQIRSKLETLRDVGLGYIQLGQPATTLSGGEAQRIKLARELSKRQTGRTFYILDEPTTGLHFEDVRKLLDVLHRLVDLGNTVVVIEHHLDVIKSADWIIDLGPEGGDRGGYVVATGTPEEVLRVEQSYTAQALRKVLTNGRRP